MLPLFTAVFQPNKAYTKHFNISPHLQTHKHRVSANVHVIWANRAFLPDTFLYMRMTQHLNDLNC